MKISAVWLEINTMFEMLLNFVLKHMFEDKFGLKLAHRCFHFHESSLKLTLFRKSFCDVIWR